MSIVTQSVPSVNDCRLAPFQAMLMTMASLPSVIVSADLRASQQSQIDALLRTAMQFMMTSPSPQGMFELEK
jgi:hypothetical protein